MIGSTIGSYEITGKLGIGGMGAVYSAKHKLIGRKAAIKVLLPQFSNQSGIVERFFNEAKAATAIEHPGIVEIYDFGYHDGAAYIVMEHLRGQSLDARIKEHRCLAPDVSLSILRQIAGALSAAHKVNIIHRDLKPENIFLVPDPDVADGERIRLLDFGIAKLTHSEINASSTRTGSVMGTPSYMSPEQCAGSKSVDHRTDLYALGCILFEMLCGRPPFIGQGAGTVIAAHIYEAPPSPSSMTAMPAEVEALVLSLLEKKPEDRPASADVVVALIDKLPNLSDYHLRRRQPTNSAVPQTIIHQTPPKDSVVGSSPEMATTLGMATSQVIADRQPRASRLLVPIVAGSIVAAAIVAFAIISTANKDDEPAATPTTTPENLPSTQGEKLAASTPDGPANVEKRTTAENETASTTKGEKPPIEPSLVRIEITSQPKGAVVHRKFDGLKLGQTPYVYEKPAVDGELEFVLKRRRYEDMTVTASGMKNQSFELTLKRKTKKRKPSSKNKEKTPDTDDKPEEPVWDE